MFESDSLTEHEPGPAAAGLPDEETRLEDAMRRADDLLVTSLKCDERRRARRKVILLSLGGLAMLATFCALLLGLALDGDKADATDRMKAVELSGKGWKLWQQGNYDAATIKFEEAVKADPKNKNALNGLGWANFNRGERNPAEEAFKQLIKLDPSHAAALNGLGQIYLSQRKYEEAEKYLTKAAARGATAAWYGLARLYLLQGKYDEAEKWAKKVVNTGDADDSAKEMLKAAKEKKLGDELRQRIEPPEPEDKGG